MKLTKETLKQIIKEELSVVLSEVYTIMPRFEDTNIPLKYKDKFLELVYGGETEQAQVLVDSFGGDQDWVKTHLAYHDGTLEHPAITTGRKKAAEPVIGSRFPWKSGNLPSFKETWKQLTGQNPHQMIQKSIEKDERSAYEDYMDAFSRNVDLEDQRELRKWWNEKIEASKRELELMNGGWDHYEVMKSRNNRLANIRPKPKL